MTAARLPPVATMLLLSASGMAVGLAIDCGTTPPALIAALCATEPGSLAAALRFHLAVMPASYAMTAVAGLLALGLTAGGGRPGAGLAAGLACLVLMMAGMVVGGWLAPEIAALLGAEPGFALLVAAMATGMALATVAGAAVARLAGRRDRVRRAGTAQYIMYQ